MRSMLIPDDFSHHHDVVDTAIAFNVGFSYHHEFLAATASVRNHDLAWLVVGWIRVGVEGDLVWCGVVW